jgi:hypothetical protein
VPDFKSPFLVDLRRTDGTHVAILSLEQYASLPADQVADTIPDLFVRCDGCGLRNDIGKPAEVARAIGVTDDYSAARRAVR